MFEEQDPNELLISPATPYPPDVGWTVGPADIITPNPGSNGIPGAGVSQEVTDIEPVKLSMDNSILPTDVIADVEPLITTATDMARGMLQDFRSDLEFEDKLQKPFGEDADIAMVKNWIARLAYGIKIPQIEVLDGTEMKGASGAFDSLNNVIYLSRDFLMQNADRPYAIASVVLEELGHFIDSKANPADSPGDEGDMFAAVVQDIPLSEAEWAALEVEDDTVTLDIDGQAVSVEASARDWTIQFYDGWRWDNNPDHIRPKRYERPDGKNGIWLDWGGRSYEPGHRTDNFAAWGWTEVEFEAGTAYKFRANADDYFMIGVSPINGNNAIEWITPTWQNLNGGFRDYWFVPNESGSYHLQFLYAEEGGDAWIDISWDERDWVQTSLWESRTNNGETEYLGIYRVDTNNRYDISNQPTWVVFHGMNSSPYGESIQQLWRTLSEETDYQVLVVDWSEGAYSGKNQNNGEPVANPYRGGSWIETVADFTQDKLVNEWGIFRDNINLIGHSLGAYVAYETANMINGGAHRLIALDPATSTRNREYPWRRSYDVNNANLNLSSVSDWSWGFYGSLAGLDKVANTAEESFRVDFPSNFNPKEAHGGVVELFANLVDGEGFVSNDFRLNEMGTWKSWWPTQDGFEATIEVVDTSEGWSPCVLSYRNNRRGTYGTRVESIDGCA